ncbi:hypothetical protein EV126DRAFT_433439 [Verticillium dahliae]|nr:hypothetical protein EV126DRAFT_433439 [Verticillium dahliae]
MFYFYEQTAKTPENPSHAHRAERRVREAWSKRQEGGEAKRIRCLLRVRDLGPGWWRHIHLRVCRSKRGKLFGRFLCGVRVLLLGTHGSFHLFTQTQNLRGYQSVSSLHERTFPFCLVVLAPQKFIREITH